MAVPQCGTPALRHCISVLVMLWINPEIPNTYQVVAILSELESENPCLWLSIVKMFANEHTNTWEADL
jgi:hypothetical protein